VVVDRISTVGYGDAFPVTPLGKLLAGLTAITGIGLIAMPTGILAAAFSDAIQRQREEKRLVAKSVKSNRRRELICARRAAPVRRHQSIIGPSSA
jgi:F0F1-type ATP synthase membrane subunit c/vacuolar-type H+-ATPase subunit K